MRELLATSRRLAATHGPEWVLRELATHLGVNPGVRLLVGRVPGPPDPALTPPADWFVPDLLGVIHEAMLDRAVRQREGAFYTPIDLAQRVAMATLGPLGGAEALSICDPAAGGGALLLAAVRAALARGTEPKRITVVAADRDPLALAVTEASMSLVAPECTLTTIAADALGGVDWPAMGTFDFVVINPPFLGQLSRATSRSRTEAAALTARFGPAASRYADAAALFAMLTVDITRPGGRIGMILPEPIIATRDGAAARAHVGSRTAFHRLWLEPAATFAAGVRVCVVIMERTGFAAETGGTWAGGDWATIGADAAGVPDCPVTGAGVIGDIAASTADFRDEFYGVARICVDDPAGTEDRPALITSGLIDVLRSGWGRRTSRVAKRQFLHPRADLAQLAGNDPLRAWAGRRLVPKALLATQTPVLEAIADETGTLLPVVPVISVVPTDPDDLWLVMAVLHAPPISALARRLAAGAALSRDAIKLSARQVAALPLPANQAPWAEGAAAARAATEASTRNDEAGWSAALDRLGTAMCEAYDVDVADVIPWWRPRLDRAALRRPWGPADRRSGRD